MPTDKLLTTMFRCNICNVISRGIVEHDKHLEGKRHKNNVAVATGEASAPAQRQKRGGASSGQETKQERKKRLEHEAVARASLLLNPALQPRPSFAHVVLNWSAATWSSSSQLPLPAEGLPARFSSSESYLEAWEPFILEEARGALQKGFEDRSAVVRLTLRSFKAANDISQHVGLHDPSILSFTIMEDSGGASGDSATDRSDRIQSGSAVILTPPCGGVKGAGPAEPLPAGRLGLVTQRTRVDLEIELVLPADASAHLEAGQGWECRLVATLAPQQRMFDSCVALRTAFPERFKHHLLAAKPQALPPSRGLPALTSQASQELNASQQAAVKAAVNAALPWPLHKEAAVCLLHGPPGTGKTTTILACLEELRSSGRILVCAPSNKAVQELCARWVGRWPHVPVSLVGVGDLPEGGDGAALRQVFVHGWAQDLALRIREWMAQAACAAPDTMALAKVLDTAKARAPDAWQRLCGQDHAALAPFLQRIESAAQGVPSNIATSLDAIVRTLLSLSSRATLSQPLEAELLSTAQLIFCTLATAGRSSLARHLGAHALIVDEAGQAVEPEVLIAVRAADSAGTLQRIVLAGDPQQLPATLLSTRAGELGFSRSLLQRLLEGADEASSFVVMLREQHRMDPSISLWPNQRFYQGKLRDAPCVAQRARRGDLGVPQLGPYTVVDVSAQYCWQFSETGATKVGTSLGNEAEAKLAARLVERFVRGASATPDAVAVITFYKGQVSVIRRELRERGIEDVRVSTVDGFQGAETDIVVLSFVRGHGCMGVGFLEDFRRLNVALTRARSTLVVLSDVSSLSLDHTWDVAAMLQDAKERSVVLPAAALRGVLP